MKIVALILLFFVSLTTSFQNILKKNIKEIYRTSDRQILTTNNEILREIKQQINELQVSTNGKIEILKEQAEDYKSTIKNITKEFETLREEMKNQTEEWKKQTELTQNKIDKCEDKKKDLVVDYSRLGFTFANKRWMIGNADSLPNSEAIQWCLDRNATFFHPVNEADHKFIEDFRVSKGITYMWYPINDSKTEGVFYWQNGTAVSSADEAMIPWESRVFPQNTKDNDCGKTRGNGVYVYECSNGSIAGIICTLSTN